MKKWKCTECQTITDDDQLLIDNNPFIKGRIIVACPSCYTVNAVVIVCDEYGCERVATFGYPTDEGYKNTCGEHMRKYKGKAQEAGEIRRLERKIEKLEADLLAAQSGATVTTTETQVTQ
ncbi:MAG: hypothetical protein IPP74_15755 [Alphaproteobacteria bacterium]|nr:hypothetical protein [Alphaproteobacteria bacterium]